MAKYENIRALAKKQLQAVTESSDRWKAFLRTAAIAYNYSFPNQLLIHEQSPTATAVADIAYWNNNAGRWVKRGAHGIRIRSCPQQHPDGVLYPRHRYPPHLPRTGTLRRKGRQNPRTQHGHRRISRTRTFWQQ